MLPQGLRGGSGASKSRPTCRSLPESSAPPAAPAVISSRRQSTMTDQPAANVSGGPRHAQPACVTRNQLVPTGNPTYNRTAVLCTTCGQATHRPWTTAPTNVDEPPGIVDKAASQVDRAWATHLARVTTCCGHSSLPTTTSCVFPLTDPRRRRIVLRSLRSTRAASSGTPAGTRLRSANLGTRTNRSVIRGDVAATK